MKNIASKTILAILVPLALFAQDAYSPKKTFSGVVVGTATFNDDVQLQWGTGNDAACEYDTAQTPDSLFCGVGQDSRVLIIGEKTDLNTDLAVAQKTNPTLHVHAADAATATKWVEISHDGTNGIVDVGVGVVSVPDGITSAGTVVCSRSTDIGWAVVDGTDNVACNTTCTNACVFGIANATGTAVTNLVACTDATADLCLCAGAN